VVVVGGTGFFGRAAAERLRSHGVRAVLASRRAGAELRVDVESRASMKTALKPYDVVLDAAGPFQARTTALIEAAIETGFDVVDLSDSLRYAERVADLRLRIEAAGVRVLTSCSSVSAVGAAAIRLSGVEKPVRLDVVLRPATRDTAHRATARALCRLFGSRGGGILFEVEDSDGALVTLALQAPAKSYLVAIAPAVLAARAIAEGRFKPTGLVPPEQHAEAGELAAYLGSLGIDRVTVRHGRRSV